MTSNGIPGRPDPASPRHVLADGRPMTRWQTFRLVVKVVELRLRFVALMAVTGLTFAYWDTLWNRYDKWMRPARQQHAAVAGDEFFCPMHPQVVQETPGQCPICGMPLAKRKKGEKAALPGGITARVQLTSSRVAQAGIRTAGVGYAPLVQTLTTTGTVAFDERRMANIVSKVPGKSRVERLHANVTGQDVEAGQPLAELYSPELAQAIQELLNGAASLDGLRPQTEIGRSLLGDRREMVRASTEKLRRWGITQAQIDEIVRDNKASYTIPILSPIGGHVLKKNVVEGQEVPEGYPMFEVADLHTVWVLAQVYEGQLGMVREGQPVEARVEAFPGESFPGRVEFLQPHLDSATRTVEVRFALDNPGLCLRPGMFATVTLKVPVWELPGFRPQAGARPASLTPEGQKTCPVTSAELGSMGVPVAAEVEGRKVWTCCGACPPKLKAEPVKYLARLAPAPKDEVLSVPESAVIDTGGRKVVYVETGPGVFDGRLVVLGPRIGDRFPVIQGLSPGEKVAEAGAFLIDAESRLNGDAAPTDSPGATPREATEPHNHVEGAPRSAALTNDSIHRH